MLDTSIRSIDALRGRRFVAIHVASNQMELIFDDVAGRFNPSVKIFGEYCILQISTSETLCIDVVPNINNILIKILDGEVYAATIDQNDDLIIEFLNDRKLRIRRIYCGQVGFEIYL